MARTPLSRTRLFTSTGLGFSWGSRQGDATAYANALERHRNPTNETHHQDQPNNQDQPKTPDARAARSTQVPRLDVVFSEVFSATDPVTPDKFHKDLIVALHLDTFRGAHDDTATPDAAAAEARSTHSDAPTGSDTDDSPT